MVIRSGVDFGVAAGWSEQLLGRRRVEILTTWMPAVVSENSVERSCELSGPFRNQLTKIQPGVPEGGD